MFALWHPQAPYEKGSILKGKKGSKLFLFRLYPFQREEKIILTQSLPLCFTFLAFPGYLYLCFSSLLWCTPWPFWKGSILKGKKGSKLFLFRLYPFQREEKIILTQSLPLCFTFLAFPGYHYLCFSSLLWCTPWPFWKGSILKEKNFLTKGANSFLLEYTPFQRWDKIILTSTFLGHSGPSCSKLNELVSDQNVNCSSKYNN